MSAYIKIERRPYEEPYHINLIFEASNGRAKGVLEYYDNADSLIDIATELEVFPRHNTDVFLYQLGSERAEDRHAYYFRFRVFLTNSTGACSIQLRFNNRKDLPDREIVEFCINTEPTGINRLGKLFREFSKLETRVLEWDGINGSVY